MMYKTLNPGLATISIWETGANHFPTGTALTSATIDGDSLPDQSWNAAWREIEFATPCELTAGHKYAIVIEATCNSPAAVGMRVDNAYPVYPGGGAIFNYQGSWTFYGDNETILFRVYGEVPDADLAIIKTDDPDPVIAGNNLTYTVTVTNNGTSNATGVSVNETIPTQTTYVSSNVTQGAYAAPIWTVGNLASGVSANMTLVVTVNSNATGTISNTANVIGEQTDPDMTNNLVTANTTVNTRADLSITKTGDSGAVAGTNFNYTIRVTNNGPSDATGVNVTDILPSGVSYYKSTASKGVYNSSTGIWMVGSLTSGETESLTLEVTANALPNTVITNSARVSGNEIDPVANNNSASQNTRIVTAVGGEVSGVSQFGILAPWLVVLLVVAAGGAFFLVKKHKVI
jgi:uncharacterized repeat protein (TIGR01451 family)